MYHIEQLTAPNLQQLQQIVKLYRDEGWWWQDEEHLDVAEKIVTGSYLFLVAVNEAAIIGMGRAISDGTSDAYIQDVAVARKIRGRGVASALLEALIRQLKQSGIDWIGLIAEKGSHPLCLCIQVAEWRRSYFV